MMEMSGLRREDRRATNQQQAHRVARHEFPCLRSMKRAAISQLTVGASGKIGLVKAARP